MISLGLNCREMTRTLSSDELADAGWPRRLVVRLHLFMCKECRRYQEQMQAIGEAARKAFRGPGDQEVLGRLQDGILRKDKN